MAKKAKKIKSVKITYCSNYNGVDITINGKYVDQYEDKNAENVCGAVINFAGATCGERGFYGDIDEVEEVAIKAVHDVYGPDVKVIFEEDDTSS